MTEEFWQPARPQRVRRLPNVPHGPPDHILGGVLGRRLILARSDQAAVSMEHVEVFPTGVAFSLLARLATAEGDWRHWGGLMAMRGRVFGKERPPTEIDSQLLRFGVEFADGGRATNVWTDVPPFFGRSGGPVLISGAGSAGGRRAESSFWLTPLPPSGPVVFAVEWPAKDIPFSAVEVDSAVFGEAAKTAEILWPDGDTGGPPSSVSMWAVDEGTNGEGADR